MSRYPTPDADPAQLPAVVFVMGAARSGSTLLGVLLGQVDGVFYAGELCDWPERRGVSSMEHGQEFWMRIRERVGDPPDDARQYKRLFEHPSGIGRGVLRRKLRPGYESLTAQLLEAVAKESSSSIVVDSSHYPRRARTLRRLVGTERLRLVYLVRRPSSVARSFLRSGDKSALPFNTYLMFVSILSWIVYLTHPRSHRAIVSYEALTESPLSMGAKALGRSLGDVDPDHLVVPPILAGNRFAKSETVSVKAADSSLALTRRDRLTDLFQWPTRLAQWASSQRNAS